MKFLAAFALLSSLQYAQADEEMDVQQLPIYQDLMSRFVRKATRADIETASPGSTYSQTSMEEVLADPLVNTETKLEHLRNLFFSMQKQKVQHE